jgi:hypothetical protein
LQTHLFGIIVAGIPRIFLVVLVIPLFQLLKLPTLILSFVFVFAVALTFGVPFGKEPA